MNKQDLIHALETSREEMLAALEGLPDDAYLIPGVNEDWSIKDILAHLVMWEAQIITLLFRAKSMPAPNTAHFGPESTEALNDRWYRQQKERPLVQVLEDFEGIREQTIRRLDDYTDAQLNNPKFFPWLDGRPLWKWIAEETFEHERDHTAQIRAWRQANSL